MLGLGAVVVIALAAVVIFRPGRSSAPALQLARIDRGRIESNVSATGTCNAVVTVQVGSQVSGNIKALYADFNTEVKMGQLVAEIDPQVFRARVDQARANLDSAAAAVVHARAQVEKADADLAGAQATLDTAQAAVAKAQATVVDARQKLARRVDLFRQGIFSREDRDTAQAAYDQSLAQVQAAEAQVDAARHNIQAFESQRAVAVTQLAGAQALVKQTQATLDQAQIDLDHTRITAPVDGTVIARHMDVGQTVAASFQAPTIFEIAQDLTQMQVDSKVDEADIGRVRVGQPASFTVDAYPGIKFTGAVTQIRQAPLNVLNVITYDVVVSVTGSNQKLFPGMTANVRIRTAEADNALRVPNAALRFRPPGAAKGSASRRAANDTVWVLGSDHNLQAVPVKLGISDGTYVEVTAGDLHAGDQVAVGTTAPAKTAAPAPAPGRGPRI